MRKPTAFLTVAFASLALAACGSSNSSSSTSTTTPAGGAAAGQAVNLSADPSGALKYNTTALSAKAGKVSVDFSNQASLAHNVTLQSASGQKLGATPTIQGSSATFTVTLKPGKYPYFCSVPGHEAAGMKGTLTVK